MNQRFFKRKLARLIMVIAVFCLSVPFLPGGTPNADAKKGFPAETPLWIGPSHPDVRPDMNFAYPDTGAIYWSGMLTIPEGATVELLCQYPHARYMSINSYDAETGMPTDSLHDVQTVPDPGSENPFLPGAKRATVRDRNFTLTLLNEFPPDNWEDRLPNTLYAKGESAQDGSLALIWRIYVPDKNMGWTGGVSLPIPRVILADGTMLDEESSYAALNISDDFVPPKFMDEATYGYLRSGAAWHPTAGPLPEYFPATNPADWIKCFDIPHLLTTWYYGLYLPTPPYGVAQYANLDNQYMTVLLNRNYGNIVVLRGKAPIAPKTYRHDPFMDGDVEVRYWSITTNESFVTTSVVDGVYDEQIPLDDDGYYTIVVSREEDRPINAYERYGVKWLDWGDNGDAAGNLDDGMLIYRHMLASPNFEYAIQKVDEILTEEAVMGEYFPETQYMSKEEFEALGNNPGLYLD